MLLPQKVQQSLTPIVELTRRSIRSVGSFPVYHNMSHFSDSPEEEFRRFHDDVHERSTQCYNVMDCEKPCRNWCRYLISGDDEDMRDGFPAVCGVTGAKAYVQCWGGDDILNSTIEA